MNELKPQSASAAGACYPAWQQQEIFCELLRNVRNGIVLMENGALGHAALSFEIAATKLRLLERLHDDSKADNNQRRDREAPSV